MKRPILLTLLATLAIAAPAHGEMLKTMPHGPYECAVAGTADGAAWVPLDGQSFIISRASRYRNTEGRGTYLLKGNELTFTSGPKNGQRLRRTGSNELREIKNGDSSGQMICMRVGSNY